MKQLIWDISRTAFQWFLISLIIAFLVQAYGCKSTFGSLTKTYNYCDKKDSKTEAHVKANSRLGW